MKQILKDSRAHFRISSENYETIETICRNAHISKTEFVINSVIKFCDSFDVSNNRGDYMNRKREGIPTQGTKQIHIRLDAATYQKIKDAAKELDLSMNDYVSLALSTVIPCSERLDNLQKEVAAHSERLSAIEQQIK